MKKLLFVVFAVTRLMMVAALYAGTAFADGARVAVLRGRGDCDRDLPDART